MDLPEDWEKKALLIIGAIFILTVIYSFNPFVGNPNNNTTMEQSSNQPTVVPFPSSEKKNKTDNSTDQTEITEEDAKRIADQAYPDYTIGTPSQGSINVNNTAYFVWIVPLTKDNTASKTIYIDVDNGNIVKEY